MDNVVKLSSEDRTELMRETARRIGLSPEAVEKGVCAFMFWSE